MTRAASGPAVLEDGSSFGEMESKREIAISSHIEGVSSLGTGNSLPRQASHQESLSQNQPEALLASADAALSVKPVTSMKLRRQVLVQSLRCANQSMTGAGTTACMVTLSSGAPREGVTVALSSNQAAVSVPGSVTVAAGAPTANFSVAVAAVTAAQTVSIAASANGSTASFGMQLNAYSPALSISSTTASFGSVSVGQTATSSVILTSSGNAPLILSSSLVNGSMFKAIGLTTPLTLNPGQTAALTLQFSPDHVSSFTGVVTISSNSTQGVATIHTSGDGVAPILSGLTCNAASVTGSATDGCLASLNAPAPTGGVAVALASNNAAVSLPPSVTVPAGASSVSFTAAVAAVSIVQTASITGTANGSAKSFSIQLNAATPTLTISSTNVAFGAVNVGQTATKTVTLTSSGNAPLIISSISVIGSLFKATGLNTPLTLNPGQSAALSLQFYSDQTSSFTGVVTITSNSTQASTINLSADGVPSVSGLTCNTQSYTGAGADSCLVSLYGAASYTGFTVSLSSTNSSVAVPPNLTIPPGSMSAPFLADVKSVSTSQIATLTATAGGITRSFTVQLGPASALLTANASSIPFGSVLINSPAEQSITLTASGNSAVTISSIAITGGFTFSGLTAPLTLNPGQTVVLNVQFTPTTAGNFSGLITIGNNASGGNISVGLSGTGYNHKVQLSWNAASSGSVVGYNVYRVLNGSTGYQRVNASALLSTTYTDGNVQGGSSYVYYVTSLDGSGLESVPSNTTTVGIPTS